MKNLNSVISSLTELYAFIKSISFFVIQNNTFDLLKLPRDTKIKLRNYVQEYIDKGVIVPLEIRQNGPDETQLVSHIYTNMYIVKGENEFDVFFFFSDRLKF